jgi:hypothetical protein
MLNLVIDHHFWSKGQFTTRVLGKYETIVKIVNFCVDPWRTTLRALLCAVSLLRMAGELPEEDLKLKLSCNINN